MMALAATVERGPVMDDAGLLKQQVIDFLAGFTVETTPGAAAKTPDYRDHLRQGALVAVTFLPGSDFADTIATAKRLRDEGFEPAPHFAARSIPSRDALEDYLKRLQGEVGVTQVVALGGAVTEPVGSFESSMELLETGLFDKYGIKTIGVAGHPEGSPDISEVGLTEALEWKNAFAERSDADFYIATQFCFEAAPIIAWDKAIQAAGNRLPIHIGIAGPATLKSLLNYARMCGIGPSARMLRRQGRSLARLGTVSAPDQVVAGLARYRATDPQCGIEAAHFYTFGGLRRATRWLDAVLAGEFDMRADRDGFMARVEL